MPEKLVPLLKDGQRVEIAVTPKDFMTVKAVPKDEHTLQTYAEAGYVLWDYYEDLTPYDGPKTAREFEKAADARKAERVAKADVPARTEARKA